MQPKWDFVDTHCHLEQDEFSADREEVITRALDLRIAMITSAIHPETYDSAVRLAQPYEGVFASIGLDPTSFGPYEDAVEYIRAHRDDIIAIGEVGLDHFIIRNHAQRDLQEHVFQEFIRLAEELGKPIQVHSRSAGKKTIDVLENADATRVHLHAFDGRASYAKRASEDLGYYFSIPTSVVRSRQKQKLVRAVDIEHLILETDSPVLGPDRETRNEPSNVPLVLNEVASILNRDREELRHLILENTCRLYPELASS
jgi:TatD DNase family protein